MTALRFIASILLLVAAVILIADVTQAGGGALSGLWVPLVRHWAALAPQSLAALQRSLQAISGLLWDPLAKSLLAIPAWLLFAALGAASAYAGRRRRRINIFTN